MTGVDSMTRPGRWPAAGENAASRDLLRTLRGPRADASAYQEAFATLVERYRGRVFRLALSILGPACSVEAEDVAQEVFLKVFQRLDIFRSESRFST